MAVSKRLRYEILRRDNYRCRYCGASAPDVKMTVDHVTPTSLGGGDNPENLVAACADCNAGKSATPVGAEVVDDVRQSALRWRAAITRASEIAAEQTADITEALDHFECHWTARWINRTGYTDKRRSPYRHPDRLYAPQPDDWDRSVRSMLAAGLMMPDIHDAVRVAMNNSRIPWEDTWRYFCGVAWKTLRDRQQAALTILENEERR